MQQSSCNYGINVYFVKSLFSLALIILNLSCGLVGLALAWHRISIYFASIPRIQDWPFFLKETDCHGCSSRNE